MGAHSEIIGNEVYVWMNGGLLYKKWLTGFSAGQSIVFDKHPSGVYRKGDSRLSITDANVTKHLLEKHSTKIIKQIITPWNKMLK